MIVVKVGLYNHVLYIVDYSPPTECISGKFVQLRTVQCRRLLT